MGHEENAAPNQSLTSVPSHCGSCSQDASGWEMKRWEECGPWFLLVAICGIPQKGLRKPLSGIWPQCMSTRSDNMHGSQNPRMNSPSSVSQQGKPLLFTRARRGKLGLETEWPESSPRKEPSTDFHYDGKNLQTHAWQAGQMRTGSMLWVVGSQASAVPPWPTSRSLEALPNKKQVCCA